MVYAALRLSMRCVASFEHTSPHYRARVCPARSELTWAMSMGLRSDQRRRAEELGMAERVMDAEKCFGSGFQEGAKGDTHKVSAEGPLIGSRARTVTLKWHVCWTATRERRRRRLSSLIEWACGGAISTFSDTIWHLGPDVVGSA